MRKLNILCVDDEQHAKDLLVTLCKRLNEDYSVFGFTSPNLALEIAKNIKIDVALLDVDMPEMDGITLAGKLREIYPRINIIVTTAYPQYAYNAYENECSGYLLKPIEFDKLKHQFEILRFDATEEDSDKLVCKCFGNFECSFKGQPLKFTHMKTKEVLAFLIDKKCAVCTNDQIICSIWDDDEDHKPYFKRLKKDLIDTISALDNKEILVTTYGMIGLNREQVSCDYLDFLEGNKNIYYEGEYMEQYFWAEDRKGVLEARRQK